MFRLFLIIGLLVLAVLLFAWIRKSRWFDNFCNSLESEPIPDALTSKQRMEEIIKEKEALMQNKDVNAQAIEELNKESEEINNFLNDLKGDAIDENKK